MNLGTFLGIIYLTGQAPTMGGGSRSIESAARPEESAPVTDRRRLLTGETSKKVLEAIITSDRPLSSYEVFQATGLPKSKRKYILYTLSLLARGGRIVRAGERHHYRYWKPA